MYDLIKLHKSTGARNRVDVGGKSIQCITISFSHSLSIHKASRASFPRVCQSIAPGNRMDHRNLATDHVSTNISRNLRLPSTADEKGSRTENCRRRRSLYHFPKLGHEVAGIHDEFVTDAIDAQKGYFFLRQMPFVIQALVSQFFLLDFSVH